MSQYDYLVVGSGLFGAVFAHEAAKAGKKVKVIEKRDHIAGNIYTKEVEGINVHEYGAHIFHTSDKAIWDYVNQFAEFNRYTNSPVANYKGEIYNLPFNMNTFNKLWGVVTPAPKTVITMEHSQTWQRGDEPYYPVNNDRNNHLYTEYKELAKTTPNVIFGGRLGHYRYYDMHQVIATALQCVGEELLGG